jgi:hypothetical protein
LLSNTKIAIQQRYLGETKLKVVVLLSRVERDKTLGEIAIPNLVQILLIHIPTYIFQTFYRHHHCCSMIIGVRSL